MVPDLTRYPTADFDAASIHGRLFRDFRDEEITSPRPEISEMDFNRIDQPMNVFRATQAVTIKPCRMAWVPVKFSQDSIQVQGQVLQLSQTLVKKGLNLLNHEGFSGSTVGRSYQIAICNKTSFAFQVTRGQRLGRMTVEAGR